MTNQLPPLTTKQQEILTLLYRFRFLDRTHVQALLGHKDKRRILSWLKDLRDKQYVDWHYDATDFAAKTKPAIYYLSLNGIRHLRGLSKYPTQELRKRYKESTRTQGFIDRCLLIADCCITLKNQNKDGVAYSFITEADHILPGYQDHFLNELKPHLYFTKQQGQTKANYLLEGIDPTLPRYQLRKRLKEYVNYYIDEDWSGDMDEAPITLFVCPSTADLLYVKRRVGTLLDTEWHDEAVPIRCATLEKVKTGGITSKIWEEV